MCQTRAASKTAACPDTNCHIRLLKLDQRTAARLPPGARLSADRAQTGRRSASGDRTSSPERSRVSGPDPGNVPGHLAYLHARDTELPHKNKKNNSSPAPHRRRCARLDTKRQERAQRPPLTNAADVRITALQHKNARATRENVHYMPSTPVSFSAAFPLSGGMRVCARVCVCVCARVCVCVTQTYLPTNHIVLQYIV